MLNNFFWPSIWNGTKTCSFIEKTGFLLQEKAVTEFSLMILNQSLDWSYLVKVFILNGPYIVLVLPLGYYFTLGYM